MEQVCHATNKSKTPAGRPYRPGPLRRPKLVVAAFGCSPKDMSSHYISMCLFPSVPLATDFLRGHECGMKERGILKKEHLPFISPLPLPPASSAIPFCFWWFALKIYTFHSTFRTGSKEMISARLYYGFLIWTVLEAL